MEKREKFGTRLGFLLLSAGCAIGLGNVWRFPYVVGQYGGAAFVLIYLVFLAVLAMPIMIMEFAVGRASQKSCASSFRHLEPKGTKWHNYGWLAMIGNYVLMMFYTTVAGWMMSYVFKMVRGDFVGMNAAAVGSEFNTMLGNPTWLMFWMVLAVLIGFGVCSIGLQKGVERITKVMMICLLGIMLVLAVRSVTLEGAGDGLRFYLIPDFGKIKEYGVFTVIYNAMSQAFFTLSVGIGSMAIFGSYLGKERSLTGESISITLLDTFVAISAGLIIFPACFAYGVEPGAGPGLIFETLPIIFNQMAGGRIWGSLFFVFMSFAALSTVIAVFENIVSFAMDLWGFDRKKSVIVNIVLVILISIPCVLGFNVLSGIQPMGVGSTIMDLEDFIVSNNLLPLGSLVYLAFCMSKYGWGWKNFKAEADEGKGMKFPSWARLFVTYVIPIAVLFIFAMGYYEKFFAR